MAEYRVRSFFGDFLAAFENGKLTALRLPGTWRRTRKPPQLKGQEGGAGRTLLRELGRFLCGERVNFTVPIAPKGTDFRKRVWRAMRRVPWGKTVSYGQLARMAGSPRATRAVGSACGANGIIIINPCHRITAAQGLGGFGSGLAWKRQLLRLEGHEP